jgi:hypothetical protein
MSFWTAIVVIVAIIALVEVIKSRHRAQGGEPAPRDDAELDRELERLRERVKVLERIATEDRETKALSAEIDRLRDE